MAKKAKAIAKKPPASGAAKFLNGMIRNLLKKGWDQERVDKMLNLDKPDRVWVAKGLASAIVIEKNILMKGVTP